MEMLLFVGLVVLVILVMDSRKTVSFLRSRLDELEYRIDHSAGETTAIAEKPAKKKPAAVETSEPLPVSSPVRRAAKRAETPQEVRTKAAALSGDPVEQPKPVETITPSEPVPSMAKRFEDLIGGKLPIWIGGIALIFAGFFLVRFSIEAGLFGPAARCVTATIFGLILIGLAEFGNRIPKFGGIFNDDLRIGHSIAGAGIAVLYATLYMASELYGLLGLTGALVGVVTVTILAFYLSQKHGPPTAIMGLIGGFAAPYVAGLGPESVAPLLIYLGVFTIGVFGLAIHRGWAWLALLATGGSVLWTTALLFMDIAGDIPFIGAFVVLLAIGGVLTIGRAGSSFGIPKPFMQAIPLGVGLLQLIMLAPLIEFSLLSWLFFGILAIFSIALAWRDAAMTPAVGGALGLCLTMIALALSNEPDGQTALIASGGFTLLFGAAGHFFMTREKDGHIWSLIAMVAPTAVLGLLAVAGYYDWSDTLWGVLCLIAAASNGLVAFRLFRSNSTLLLPLASGLAAISVAAALYLWTPFELAALVTLVVGTGLAFWARYTSNRGIMVEAAMATIGGGLLMLISGAGIWEAILQSLSGETDLYGFLPSVTPMLIELVAPAAVIVAIAFLFRDVFDAMLSRFVGAIGLVGLIGFTYLLAKQPLAIGPIQDFVQYGFAERALFTHLLAALGWVLLWRTWPEKFAAPLESLGIALAGLAMFRFVYFDMFLLSPTAVKQLVGPAPLANLASLHYGAAAIWLWLFGRTNLVKNAASQIGKALDIASLLAAMAAVMVTVRQAVHGTDIATPSFTSTETYLYSAGLMLLAIAWMVRGIKSTNALLRIAGLLLLTLVTFKVFLFDARQLEGILRILSFLGLGIALIGIGWIYGKVMRKEDAVEAAAAE